MDLRTLLRERRFEEITKPSQALKFLYDADEFYRFRGSEALGALCRGKVARNFILRLFWHLSDESGAYCIAAPLGIAEIGRTNPNVFEGFKNKFVSLLDDWEVERKYVAYGIYRLGKIVEDSYPNPVEKLTSLIDTLNADFKAYAILALSKLDRDVAEELMRKYENSEDTVSFYDGKSVRRISLRGALNLIRRGAIEV